jgi:hypothetical protein
MVVTVGPMAVRRASINNVGELASLDRRDQSIANTRKFKRLRYFGFSLSSQSPTCVAHANAPKGCTARDLNTACGELTSFTIAFQQHALRRLIGLMLGSRKNKASSALATFALDKVL